MGQFRPLDILRQVESQGEGVVEAVSPTRRRASATVQLITPETSPETALGVQAVPVQAPVAMAERYLNYKNSAASRLEFSSWYSVKHLMTVIKAVRKINFSVVEQRQQALQRLNNMDDDTPFSETSRFKEEGNFICESEGDWARKLMQLKSALSFKERLTSGKERADVGNDYNDSQQAFWNSTTAFFDQMRRSDGIYNREEFEDFYGLRWGRPGANA